MLRKTQVVGLVILLGIAMAVVWYIIASDYSYDAISGVYNQSNATETSTLTLKKDQSFAQEVTHNGVTWRAYGSWRRIGQGNRYQEYRRKGVFDFEGVPDGKYRLVVSAGPLCAASVPLLVAAQTKSKPTVVVHMRPSGLDSCSYGELEDATPQ